MDPDVAPRGGKPTIAYPFAEMESRWGSLLGEPSRRPDGDGGPDPRRRFKGVHLFAFPGPEGFSPAQLRGFVTLDVLGRYHRLQGDEVQFRLLWDILAAEEGIWADGASPRQTAEETLPALRQTLRRLGISPAEEILGTDPRFARWTQQLFLELQEKGLVSGRREQAPWCSACGRPASPGAPRCGGCGSTLEMREQSRWILRLGAFADQLLSGLEGLDWPADVKAPHRDLIGRRAGSEVVFKVGRPSLGHWHDVLVFAEEPELLAGVSFLLLAPEHPVIDDIVEESHREEVEAYRKRALAMGKAERRNARRRPTAEVTGAVALNPITLRRVAVLVCDAIAADDHDRAAMGLPAYNRRDLEIARTHRLPVWDVIRWGEPHGSQGSGEGGGRGGGMLAHSGPFSRLPLGLARERVTGFLKRHGTARDVVRFGLGDRVFSRRSPHGIPVPIVHCEACGAVPCAGAAPEGGDGTGGPTGSPEVECPKCKGPSRWDPDAIASWLGSCWFFLELPRGDPDADALKATQEGPVDLCVSSRSRVAFPLLVSRFMVKFLRGSRVLRYREPSRSLITVGPMAPPDPEKEPPRIDEALERFGSDAVRFYLLSQGPTRRRTDWSEEGLRSAYRFLARVWRTMVARVERGRFVSKKVLVAKHVLIDRVARSIARRRLHTAASAFRRFVNALNASEMTVEEVDRQTIRTFVVLLAPFAPHVSLELWHRLGEKGDLFTQGWPEASRELLSGPEMRILVQVNARRCDRFSCPQGTRPEELGRLALGRERVREVIDGRRIIKIVNVPERLVNIVVAGPAEARNLPLEGTARPSPVPPPQPSDGPPARDPGAPSRPDGAPV